MVGDKRAVRKDRRNWLADDARHTISHHAVLGLEYASARVQSTETVRKRESKPGRQEIGRAHV